MKLLLKLTAFLLFSSSIFAIGIATGSKSGTYLQIGKDIKKIYSYDLEVLETQGSIDNIKKLLSDKDTQLAIMQFDALIVAPEIIGRSVDKIKMIFPLYEEEVHLIARKDKGITNIRDLEDKKVNMGKKNSGSWVTSSLISETTGIEWREYNYSTTESLFKLIDGELDAIFCVVGSPSAILSALPEDSSEIIEIIDINERSLLNLYTETTIKKGTYTWLNKDVNTIGVNSILATFDYKNSSQKEIKQIIVDINKNLNKLRREGHSKWEKIDPMNYKKISWPIHPIAKEVFEGKSNLKNNDVKNKMLQRLENFR